MCSGTYPAYFGEGTKLTVLELGRKVSEPKVRLFRPSKKECKNKKDDVRKKTLVCVATDFYPDHVKVKWEVNEVERTDGVATDPTAQLDGTSYRITSRLRVLAEEYENPGSIFKCIVTFYNGTKDLEFSDFLPGVEANRADDMTREKYLRITQNAKLSYIVLITKSCIYGLFVIFLVWMLKSSRGKQHN